MRAAWSIAGLLAAGAGAGTAAAVTPAAARSCGEVVVAPGGGASYYSVNRVTVRGRSCAGARALVRRWASAAQRNEIPQRVIAATRHGVIGYGYPGASYRFDGATCRWTNTAPVHTAYLPGRGRCTSGGAVVAWTYRGATNPSVGPVTGCARGVRWRHGDASDLRVRAISCARARSVVSAALDHGLLRHDGATIEIARRSLEGFTFGAHGPAVTGRRGQARIAFRVCWYDVDC